MAIELVIPDMGIVIPDATGDGEITFDDFEPAGIERGSEESKAAWKEVEERATSDEAEARAFSETGDKSVKGWYDGGPLRPGPHPGDRDFRFIVDRAKAHGYTDEQANRVAGKVYQDLYGK